MLRPDSADAESRQTGHGVAGSSTTSLAPTHGQQLPSTRLTPSPHCSQHSISSMLDHGSESMLRRIWNNTEDGGDDSSKPFSNRSYISRQTQTSFASPPPDHLHQSPNANQSSARGQMIPSTFPGLRNFELEMEALRSKTLNSREEANLSLSTLKLGDVDSQHTRAASNLQVFRHRGIPDTDARIKTNESPLIVPNDRLQVTDRTNLSIWSSYGLSGADQRPAFDNSPAPLRPRLYTDGRHDQCLHRRSRAISDTIPLDTIYRQPATKANTSYPSYPKLLGQQTRFKNYNTHDVHSFSYAVYPPNSVFQQQQQQSRSNGGFQPMYAVLTANSSNAFIPPVGPSAYHHQYHPPPSTPGQAQISSRFSSRYHGMHTESNASVDHLAPEENAGLWLTNLPPDVTPNELLSAIRNIGRIWCSYINEPDFTQHVTAAAKVVFFQPQAALRLLRFSTTCGLNIRGFRVKVAPNRIKTPEQPLIGNMSRVLIITGHFGFVNTEILVEYFTGRFVFQLDEVRELVSLGERSVVEFRFGSFRCQAQMGKMSLEKDRPDGFEKVEFGDDPCEVGETTSSLAVAMQRIAGIGL